MVSKSVILSLLQETVRKAADVACKSLHKVTVRACESPSTGVMWWQCNIYIIVIVRVVSDLVDFLYFAHRTLKCSY